MGRKFKVAILGSGPSAAFAFRACMDLGVQDINVYSLRFGNFSVGAFWIYEIPKSITGCAEPEEIEVVSVGERETYISKQWGTPIPQNYRSSFPDAGTKMLGYNPNTVLPSLWDGVKFSKITNAITDEVAIALAKDYNVVFQTFPSEMAVRNRHKFLRQFTVVSWEHPDKTVPLPNRVTYNGTPMDLVRSSFLFGWHHLEYPPATPKTAMTTNQKYSLITGLNDLHPLTPPLTEHEILARNIYPVGRYAEYKRSMLSHEAYSRVTNILKENI